ncbi:DNA polymerase/3'-5' exonuclease PolX [Negadavirga shengliensis]|uniref:DNA polymerase/3'-5' exonuclease PolX n=1 Tax=Negadavirga shengliensis TaxID=1389218 RepID=A0ABV9T6U7_9BACT
MDNKYLIKILKLTIQLMELHEVNPFKIRNYQSAVINIEREGRELAGLDLQQLQEFSGIGKSIAEVILEIQKKGTHVLLEALLQETPEGILEVLEIKGLGPRKIRTLWKDLGITSTHELLEACRSGQVARLKGFGEKTQESIIQALEFIASNKDKWLYADIDTEVDALLGKLQETFGEDKVACVGDYARKLEIIDQLSFIIATDQPKKSIMQLNDINGMKQDIAKSSPYRWGGKLETFGLDTVFLLVPVKDFVKQKLIKTASRPHLLSLVNENQMLAEVFINGDYTTEEEAYQQAGLPFIPEELREGQLEPGLATNNIIPDLLEFKDLKGPLHNHSTYSDGRHSLKEMAAYCQSQGYEYLGIADHSRSAFYANGLDEDRIVQQHREIDQLNKEMAPFRIFKGIESDILIDGNLDYSDDILARFEYIVASVHSSLGMDRKKATARLLKAIQNPYTTILGHPTGRLLLRREGYPIDHKVIIDACASYGVVIEINANPWRLDLDWRWVHYAMEKGVMLSINPDAHEKEAFMDMKYGVLVGRKGGLTKKMTLNALDLDTLAGYLEERKKKP